MSLSKVCSPTGSGFTTADTCDSFSFLYREIGQLFGKAKVAVVTAGIILGGKCLYKFLYHGARFLYIYYFETLSPQTPLFSKVCGSWAVVFGATDDLGPEFSRLLACYGLNLLLIGDDETGLNELASSIGSDCGVKAETICLDKKESLGQFSQIIYKLRSKWIGLLINNWGSPLRIIEDYRPLNVFSDTDMKLAFMTIITRVCTEAMISTKAGAVITVTCSEADCQGLKYSPDLKYIHAYVEEQHKEWTKGGLTVQLFQPFRAAIVTDNSDEPFFKGQVMRLVPTSKWYAYKSLKVLGTSFSTSGYWSHSVFAGVWHMVPNWGRQSFKEYVHHQLNKYNLN